MFCVYPSCAVIFSREAAKALVDLQGGTINFVVAGLQSLCTTVAPWSYRELPGEILLFAQCRPLTLDRWSPDPRYDVLAACGTWFQKGSGMSRQSYDLLALNLDRRLIVSPSFQSVVE